MSDVNLGQFSRLLLSALGYYSRLLLSAPAITLGSRLLFGASVRSADGDDVEGARRVRTPEVVDERRVVGERLCDEFMKY